MHDYLFITIEILYCLFLLTGLVAGWFVLAYFYFEKKEYSKSLDDYKNEAYTLNAREELEKALDDYREELIPIKAQNKQIITLLKQLTPKDEETN